VIAGDGEVEVRGTSFAVEVDADRLVAVGVSHGVVEVTPRGGAPIALHAGECWSRPGAIAGVAPCVTLDEQAPAAREAAPPTSPPPAATPRPPSTIERTAPRPIPHDRPPALTAPRGATAALPPDPPGARAEPRSPSMLQSTAAEELFAQGFEALRLARYDLAVARFAASIAAGDAIRDAPLTTDARYWLTIALARAGRRGEAARSLADFLVRYPRSERAGRASVTLGWLLLESGDAAGAAARFRTALGEPDAAVAEGARQGLAASTKP
jgi:TolA-binding protein